MTLTVEGILENMHKEQPVIIGYYGPGILNYPRVFELKYYLKGTSTKCREDEKFNFYKDNEVEAISARLNDEDNKVYVIISVHGNNKSS